MTSTTASTLEHSIGLDGLFVLHLASGNVRLHGIDGEAVQLSDKHGLELADIFEIEAAEGSLALRARKGVEFRVGSGRGRFGRSPELDVRLPRRATIVVEAASADLSGEDLVGDQRFHTASGDIELERIAGTVAVEAVSGDVTLTATGELRLKARTVSGDLAVRAGTLSEVAAATTSGDVAIAGELAPDVAHRVETVSGDALLALAGGARIEVSTMTGDVTSDVPHRSEGERARRVVIIGDGRATLVARSMSGDVRIARALPYDVPVDAARAAAAPPAPEAPQATPPSASDVAIAAAYEDARLGILRSLERGEIDVAEAGRRLEALDAAGIPEDGNRG